MRGIDAVDLTRQEDVYCALRQTLVSRHDELELFDRAFNAWFLRAPVLPPVRTAPSPVAQEKVGETLSDAAGGEPDDEAGDPLELGASGHELLRDKDFAEMTPDEYRARQAADRGDRRAAAAARLAPAARRTRAVTASTCAS